MAKSSEKDLDSFLGKVDEIENLVKGLNSSCEDVVKTSMAKADQLIAAHRSQGEVDEEEGIQTKTGFSKTSINKSSTADVEMTGGPDVIPGMNQEAFMAVLEADARERAERRRVREKEATEIKEKGNHEFKEGNYDSALELYTQAINKVRDSTALYTNRAQTYIKLGRYQDAITDCDWALRVSPACIKAYIHAGRAHLSLKQYDKARDFYKQALEKDPKKEEIIQEYLAEVDRVEQTHHEEKTALELFESGDTSVKGLVETLVKVKKSDQLPLFYSGGFRIISSLITSTEDRTLFRTHGGLVLPCTHPELSRCLSSCPVSLSKEERDLLVAAVDMLTHACSDNEANQEQLFENPDLSHQLLRLLEVKLKGHGRMLKSACVNLLFSLTLTAVGRRVICTKFDHSRLLASLFSIMHKTGAVAVKAVSCLNNMALDKVFLSKMRDVIQTDIFPVFHKLVHSSSCQPEILASCITTMINLATDTHIRSQMKSSRELWEDSIYLLVKFRPNCSTNPSHRDMVREVLGLVMILSVEASPNSREFGQEVCQHCVQVCQLDSVCVKLVERSLVVLSYILPHVIPAVEWACQNHGPKLFLQYLKGSNESQMKSSLKCLTACTQLDESAQKCVVHNKGLGRLKDLLNHSDETVVGNAALCLSQCVLVDKASKALVKTDIIKDLLVLARDGKRPAVQQNCAILIAKLAQSDTKHLERLRELHGIEILHTCMKYIK